MLIIFFEIEWGCFQEQTFSNLSRIQIFWGNSIEALSGMIKQDAGITISASQHTEGLLVLTFLVSGLLLLFVPSWSILDSPVWEFAISSAYFRQLGTSGLYLVLSFTQPSSSVSGQISLLALLLFQLRFITSYPFVLLLPYRRLSSVFKWLIGIW